MVVTWNRYIGIAVCAALGGLLAWLATFTSPIGAFENFLFDYRVSVHGEPRKLHPRIIIIAIDDASMEDLSFTSPLNRKFLASVVDRLDKAGTRAIGIDFILDRATDPQDDAVLARAISQASSPIVLVTDPGKDGRAAICRGEVPPARIGQHILSRFAAIAALGHGVLCVDTLDEVLRSGISGLPGHPSFTEALHMSAGGEAAIPAGDWPIPFYKSEDAGWPFATYSASHLDQLPAAWLEDRVVLVGPVIPYSGDWQTTPLRFARMKALAAPQDLFPKDELPGIVVHAYALAAMMAGETGFSISPRQQAMLAILGGLLGGAIGLVRAHLSFTALMLFGALAAGWLLASYLFAQFAVMLPVSGFAIGLVASAGSSFALLEREERQRRRFIHDSFAHFLAPQIVDELVRSPKSLQLSAEAREVTLLFTDLAGFTRLVDTVAPDRLVPALNGYLDTVIEAVLRHGGAVDKIVGDAVHAMFSAPVPDPDHRRHALACALDIESASEAYRARMRTDGLSFGETRIGVNSGPALVGNFGNSKRFDYTAHGSTVNLAARLEEANKLFGTRICVSDDARTPLEGGVFREIGTVDVRGLADGVRVFELRHADSLDNAALAAYREAFELVGRDPCRAHACFSRLRDADPEDGLVSYQLERLLAEDAPLPG